MTTQNDEILRALESMGLSENQAAVYLANLELGASSIWDISKKSGVKRPTCYVLLEELMWRGLASSTNDGKRVLYTVASTKQLMQYEERRHKRALQVATELEAIASKSTEKPNIRQYSGVEGVKEACNLVLLQPRGTELKVYASLIMEKEYEEFLNEFAANRVKHGIPTRLLYPDTPECRDFLNRELSKQSITTKFLPQDKYEFAAHEMMIFGDMIVYLAHSVKEPFATVIESSTLANGEKQLFEMLWELAKD
ncbi:MAG: helix-turn-helix domain-containing protein [Candidatus Berkelbacteria bacterium]